MKSTIISTGLILLSTLVSQTSALQALANSPCAAKCGNVLSSTTGKDDITCYDRDYGTLSKGNIFQSCINCQLSSKYVDPATKQTDLQWALYNLRYAVSWCLYGYPNNTEHGATPCITSTACGKLENAFEFDSLSPNATAYGFCALMHEDIIPKCSACIAQSDEFYITNFVTTLTAACRQQPIAGSTVSIEGNLFSKIRVNITDPNAVAQSEHRHIQTGLPLGAKVGIAVGAIVVVLALLGCCIVWRGKKKRRQIIAQRQRQSGYADWVASAASQRSPVMAHGYNPHSPRQFFDSPVSGRALVPDQTWGRGIRDDESPMSAYPGQEKGFSPYSSHYSSPVSATDQVQVVGREWPMAPGHERYAMAGATALSKPPSRSRSREKKEKMEVETERIEMQNVAPVLLHPGPGRVL